jgi:hypothetical protein
MAGLLSMIPGVKKFTGAMSKLGGSSSKAPAAPAPSIGIADAAASSPAQVGWAERNGVNGTTSPKGIGKWGV